MPSDKLKQLISKYDRPQNYEKLVVPKVKQKNWVQLQKRQKVTDLRFSHMQELVVNPIWTGRGAKSPLKVSAKYLKNGLADLL